MIEPLSSKFYGTLIAQACILGSMSSRNLLLIKQSMKDFIILFAALEVLDKMESTEKFKKKRSYLRTVVTKSLTKFEMLIKDESKQTDDYLEILDQLNDREDSLKNLNKGI